PVPTAGNGEDQQLFALALSPGGKVVATVGRRGYVRLWTAEGLKSLSTQLAPVGGAPAVAYSGDGRHLFTLGGDETVCRWDGRITPVRLLQGHKGPCGSPCSPPTASGSSPAAAGRAATRR